MSEAAIEHQPDSQRDMLVREQRKEWGRQLRAYFDGESKACPQMKTWLANHPAGIDRLRQLYTDQLPLGFASRRSLASFRQRLVESLELFTGPSYCVIMIGSGTTGFKGNPKKEPQMYPPPTWERESDADIAVFFDRALNHLKGGGGTPNAEYPTIWSKHEFNRSTFGQFLTKLASDWERETGLHVSFKLNTTEDLYPIFLESGIVLAESPTWVSFHTRCDYKDCEGTALRKGMYVDRKHEGFKFDSSWCIVGMRPAVGMRPGGLDLAAYDKEQPLQMLSDVQGDDVIAVRTPHKRTERPEVKGGGPYKWIWQMGGLEPMYGYASQGDGSDPRMVPDGRRPTPSEAEEARRNGR